MFNPFRWQKSERFEVPMQTQPILSNGCGSCELAVVYCMKYTCAGYENFHSWDFCDSQSLRADQILYIL